MSDSVHQSLLPHFDYSHWANLEMWSALEGYAEKSPAKAWELLAHIAAAELLWQQRILGEPSGAVWPAWRGAELRNHLNGTWKEWRRMVAEEDLSRTVNYTNSKGEPWTSTTADIMEHVLFHAAYHRGQIVMQLRQAGLEPPYTDYIHAVRQKRF
jgi:uncharacterized damage-inducible protein DinB